MQRANFRCMAVSRSVCLLLARLVRAGLNLIPHLPQFRDLGVWDSGFEKEFTNKREQVKR